MNRPPCSPSARVRPLDHLVLDRLADDLLAARCGTSSPGANLLAVRLGRDGVELGLKPVPDGLHPVDVLLGYRFPSGLAAGGVMASGTAHRLDQGTSSRVHVVALVDRHGHCIHRVGGGDPLPATTGSPLEGRVVDLLHRALGQTTPPPEVPPSILWDLLWLDAVVAEVAADPGAPRTFEDLARHHPLAPAADSGSGGSIEAHGGCWSNVDAWATVRRVASQAGPVSGADRAVRRALRPLVSTDAAGWMDEGCLARWLLGSLPSPGLLLAALDALLPPGLATRLHQSTNLGSIRDPRDGELA